jgi:hypothetical protein
MHTTLHNNGDDKIKWRGIRSNLNFLICFGKRTPVSTTHYGKVKPNSGRIMANPSPGQTLYFKYNVEACGQWLSPASSSWIMPRALADFHQAGWHPKKIPFSEAIYSCSGRGSPRIGQADKFLRLGRIGERELQPVGPKATNRL